MASGPGEFSVTVHSAKQARLFLKARIMDWIMDYCCDTACAGYVSADPAGYYYDVPVRDPEDPSGSIGSSKDGTRVTLTANPNPGFVFDHWEGDGICWTSTAYITMTDPAYAQLREASCRKFGDKDKPVTNDTIYIQMNNKATFDDDNKGRYSGEDRTITAVYMPDNAAIAVINAGLNSLNGMEATAKANGYKRFVTLQSKTKAKVLREVARGKVFAFAGHGSDPGSNPPPGVGQGTHMCGFQGNTLADTLLGFSEIGTNKQYRLVMFACCYCGLHASDWESAFNADVFIGFKDNVQGLPAEMFGDSFWMYANTRWQDGTLYSLSYSAFKAWGDQVNNASTYIPAYSDELVFEPQGSPITIENVTCQ
jgi:hypothetical protein